MTKVLEQLKRGIALATALLLAMPSLAQAPSPAFEHERTMYPPLAQLVFRATWRILPDALRWLTGIRLRPEKRL